MANNPCDIAMTHINQYDEKKGLPPRHFALAVSIGTGIFPDHRLSDGGDGKDFGILNFKKQVQYVKDLTKLLAAAVSWESVEMAGRLVEYRQGLWDGGSGFLDGVIFFAGTRTISCHSESLKMYYNFFFSVVRFIALPLLACNIIVSVSSFDCT